MTKMQLSIFHHTPTLSWPIVDSLVEAKNLGVIWNSFFTVFSTSAPNPIWFMPALPSKYCLNPSAPFHLHGHPFQSMCPFLPPGPLQKVTTNWSLFFHLSTFPSAWPRSCPSLQTHLLPDSSGLTSSDLLTLPWSCQAHSNLGTSTGAYSLCDFWGLLLYKLKQTLWSFCLITLCKFS